VLLLVVVFYGAIAICYFLFNSRGEKWPYPTVEQLEEQGLIASTNFQAKRAFEVEEYEDEGLHYFLELEDGSVLYLNGQYLYDYEPVDDAPELLQGRQFPCTDFTVKRHKTKEYVVDVVTRGTPFEVEATAPSFSRQAYRAGIVPEDGDITRDKSFEQIKQELMNEEWR